MRPDVMALRNFYATPLGAVTAGMIARSIKRSQWHLRAGNFLAMGYCWPVLERLELHAPATELMPAGQGAEGSDLRPGSQRTALVEETCLPLSDAETDNLLLIQSLEHCMRPQALAREIWRILTPGGRAMIIVPNRRRLWSSVEATPFGHGYPFSRRQIQSLLSEHLLTPLNIGTALFVPPVQVTGVERLAQFTEGPGLGLFPAAGGLLVVEAEKRMGGAIPSAEREAALRVVRPTSNG